MTRLYNADTLSPKLRALASHAEIAQHNLTPEKYEEARLGRGYTSRADYHTLVAVGKFATVQRRRTFGGSEKTEVREVEGVLVRYEGRYNTVVLTDETRAALGLGKDDAVRLFSERGDLNQLRPAQAYRDADARVLEAEQRRESLRAEGEGQRVARITRIAEAMQVSARDIDCTTYKGKVVLTGAAYDKLMTMLSLEDECDK